MTSQTRDERKSWRPAPLWRGVLATGLGLTLGVAAILRLDDEPAEAFATLGAAVIGIGAHEIGLGSASAPGKRWKAYGVLWVTAAAAIVVAIGRAIDENEYLAAALTLAIAVAGVIALHHAHEKWEFAVIAEEGELLGWSLILFAVLAGVVGILAWPGLSGAVATVAAPLVALGTAILGHANGRRRTNPGPGC